MNHKITNENPRLVIYVGNFITTYKDEVSLLDIHICGY